MTDKWYRHSLSVRTEDLNRSRDRTPMGRDRGLGEDRDRERSRRTVLDERLFRRVPLFGGDLSKYRGWFFDLVVAIGTADFGLASELKRLMRDMLKPEKLGDQNNVELWTDLDDPELDMGMWGIVWGFGPAG